MCQRGSHHCPYAESMDVAVELQKIYDGEINIEIGWVWDGGIDVRLGSATK